MSVSFSKYLGCYIKIGKYVLMVQEHFRGQELPRNLAFPGGTRELGEKTQITLLRELQEETGLDFCQVVKPVASFGAFKLFACKLNWFDKLKMFLRVFWNGSYMQQGPEGERIRVTLVDPKTVRVLESGIEEVQEAFGSRNFTPLAFKNQLSVL